MTRERHWTVEDELAVVDAVSMEGVQTALKTLLRRSSPELLVHGNFDGEQARSIKTSVFELIQPELPHADLLHPNRVLKLPSGRTTVFLPPPVSNQNSAIEVHLQISADPADRVLAGLFRQIFMEPAFSILRTQEQLGYIVSLGCVEVQGVAALCFLIQSAERDPLHLDARVEAFLADHAYPSLLSLTEAAFEVHRRSRRSKLLCRPKRLSEEASTHWSQPIYTQRHEFDRAHSDAAILERITLLDLQLFADRCVWHAAPERRKLAIHLWSDTLASDQGELRRRYEGRGVELVEERVLFVKRCPLFAAV